MKIFSKFETLLFAFFSFIALLLACRVYYTGSLLFLFLVWNLFLAWIPFQLSRYLLKNPSQAKLTKWTIFFTWLLFFPNALYIITDLVHLDLDTSVPKWFDVLLLLTAALTGLIMAFISLYRVEKFLERNIKISWMPMVIPLILFLGSFGVYLGRFLRWNSWDLISNPFSLMMEIGERFFYPAEHLLTWGITFLLTIFFYLLYVSIKKLPIYLQQEAGSSQTK